MKDYMMSLDVSIVKRLMDLLSKETEKLKVNPKKRNYKEAFENIK
jgi:hypothetical protein